MNISHRRRQQANKQITLKPLGCWSYDYPSYISYLRRSPKPTTLTDYLSVFTAIYIARPAMNNQGCSRVTLILTVRPDSGRVGWDRLTRPDPRKMLRFLDLIQPDPIKSGNPPDLIGPDPRDVKTSYRVPTRDSKKT